jgi:WD40 repeat protein/surface antigen Omp85-like protein
VRATRLPCRAIAALALLLAAASPIRAASLFDPKLKFRTLSTDHFVIHFHQGEDALAQRLAAIAEDAWQVLQRTLAVTPPRRTRVVLADQTDLANGYATPVPYDTIVIYTVTPSGTEFDFDDWLRLVFTHEFTHIVHLDRSEGWARAARAIFGRLPFAFPNLFLPMWQIEGLATYEESAITGSGRLHAGDFRAIVDEAARARALEPLDRINGGLTDWPGGTGAYAYGVGFHQYLVDRFGGAKLAELAEATARRLPYLSSRAFTRVYGEPLGVLWREYQQTALASVAPAGESTARRVTHQGFSVRAPRFDRFTCAGCPAEVVYSVSNADEFPAMYRVRLDGSAPEHMMRRYLGSTAAPGRDAIYFDQLEIRRNVGVYGDLYAVSRSDGRVRQLTREARVLEPDLSPDGGTLACVQDRPGQRDLVLVSVAAGASSTITTLVAEPDTQFNAPRWSPDGRTIAVERHRIGTMPELVVVDVASAAVRVVASASDTRFVAPAWRPDGGAIVAAVARGEDTFNLFEFVLDGSGARQLTTTSGGATWPDVSPDGRTLVFVGYTPDGFDVFAMPYPATGGQLVSFGAVQAATAPAILQPYKTAGYSPLPTLKPTSWSPVLETGDEQVRVGLATGGVDVLGYHGYAAAATWLVASPDDAPTPNAAAPDWNVFYAYDRWRPTLYASASSETSFFAGPATDAGTPALATRRERQLQAGVVFPIRHARVSHAGSFSVVRAVDEFTLPDRVVSRDRVPLRASWQTITSRTYGYSISREHGVAAGATAEIVRRGLGSFADATVLTADARAYLPALAPHHVVALRIGGGVSNGDPTVGRTFRLGGADPALDVADFDNDAFSLLRGFHSNTFAGSHVAVANAEYRLPLVRPQRGIGTWPIFLHTIHAAVFADAGHAWNDEFRADSIKTSFGGELSTDLVAGYFAPFTATVGAAWGHDGSGLVENQATFYFRIGRGF